MIEKIVKRTRNYRKLHRYVGIGLFFFFFIVAVSGILLGWKKHSGGLILPNTETGTSKSLATWLPIDSLSTLAKFAIQEKHQFTDIQIDRMDIRPEKGVVKVSFKGNYYEVQLDGATGNVLAVNQRNSDIIEQIHDGTIFDNVIFANGYFKLTYTSLLGLGLIFLTISGFWLWYNPKRIRKLK
jgi:uncharacterized iron-regulated membrane protein